MEKRFLFLYVTVFFNILGFGLIFPILPLFATKLQASSFQIGLLVATVALMQFLFSPILGRISDRYGRKPVLLWSIFVSSASYFIIGTAHNLPQVFLGMALQGIGNAGVLPVSIAYVADVTSGHLRSKFVSRITGTFALGFMIGPAIGGFLGEESITLPYFAAGLISLLNTLLIAFFLKETHHARDTKLAIKEGLITIKPLFSAVTGKLGPLFILLFAWSFYIGNFNLTIPFFTMDHFNFGPHDNGIFFSSVGLISGITQWFLLPIIERRIGDLRVIFIGALLLLIGQFLVPFSGTVLLFYTFFVITVLGSSLIRPSLSSYISKHTKEGQGSTMGIATSFESLGRVISPLMMGYFMVQFGTSIPFWITSFVVFLAFLLFWKVEMRKGFQKQ